MTRQLLMTGALANQTHFCANRKKNATEKERAKELRKIIIDLAFQHSSSPDALADLSLRARGYAIKKHIFPRDNSLSLFLRLLRLTIP